MWDSIASDAALALADQELEHREAFIAMDDAALRAMAERAIEQREKKGANQSDATWQALKRDLVRRAYIVLSRVRGQIVQDAVTMLKDVATKGEIDIPPAISIARTPDAFAAITPAEYFAFKDAALDESKAMEAIERKVFAAKLAEMRLAECLRFLEKHPPDERRHAYATVLVDAMEPSREGLRERRDALGKFGLGLCEAIEERGVPAAYYDASLEKPRPHIDPNEPAQLRLGALTEAIGQTIMGTHLAASRRARKDLKEFQIPWDAPSAEHPEYMAWTCPRCFQSHRLAVTICPECSAESRLAALGSGTEAAGQSND